MANHTVPWVLGCEKEVATQDCITTVHVSAIHSEGMIDSRSVSSCAGAAASGMVPVSATATIC